MVSIQLTGTDTRIVYYMVQPPRSQISAKNQRETAFISHRGGPPRVETRVEYII